MDKGNVSKFNFENLSPIALGRLRQQLDKLYSFSDGVFTLRYAIERLQTVEKTVSDGMIDYDRCYFNRLGSNKDQEKYIANLKAKKLYFVNSIKVPKLVYDAIKSDGR